MERTRQVAAVIGGIIVIIVFVLLAKWTGDQIRQKFSVSKPAVTVSPTVSKEEQKPVPATVLETIPETGPEDFWLIVFTVALISGGVIIRLSQGVR